MRRAALALVIALAACEPQQGEKPSSDAGASPNATIVPAPLATDAPEVDASAPVDAGAAGIPVDSAGRMILPDGGAPPPEPFRTDAPIAAENVTLKDVGGVTLEGSWRWRDVPAPPKAPEVSAEGIREAVKQTALTWKIDLAESGRMRIEFTSNALPLPVHSEIRQRLDRYGSLILWPNATQYRIIPAGALRTVMGERRVDITPLSTSSPKRQGDGRKLGVATKKLEVSSNLGSVKLEVGKVPDAGEGATLLCRAFIELIGIDPRSPVCAAGEVPLVAQFAWTNGGGVMFEVTSIGKRTDFPLNALLVPPPGATFATAGLPEVPQMIFLTREALVAFRTGPLTLPPVTDSNIPGEGFTAFNHTDVLQYLLVDGVPVVAVPPASDRYVIGPQRGRYVVEWRTFLGEEIGPPKNVEMPARLVVGNAPDAGAIDGGG